MPRILLGQGVGVAPRSVTGASELRPGCITFVATATTWSGASTRRIPVAPARTPNRSLPFNSLLRPACCDHVNSSGDLSRPRRRVASWHGRRPRPRSAAV